MKFLDLAYSKIADKSDFPILKNRFFATVIDCVIIFLLLKPIAIITDNFMLSDENIRFLYGQLQTLSAESPEYNMVATKFNDALSPKKSLLIGSQLLQLFLVLLYFFLSWFYFSASPGKMIMGMKIVDLKTREKPSLKQILARLITGIASTGLFMIGFLFAIFSKQRRALHDLASGTVVVKASFVQKKEAP